MNTNKYDNVIDFINACKEDASIRRLIDSDLIREITKETLIENNIKPSPDGFFYKNQIFELGTTLVKKAEKDYGEISTMGTQELDRTNIIKFIKYLDPEAPEIKRFLLATLSSQFQEEIENIRKKYGIPESGFNNDKEHSKWVDKKNKLARKELKDITLIDRIIKHRQTGYVFGGKDDYIDNIFTSWGKLKEEYVNLFNKYKLPAPFIAGTYTVWGLNDLSLANYLNSYNFSNPFVTPTKCTLNDEKGTVSWGMPKNRYGIFIRRPVTKKSLKGYVDQHWERIKKEMEYYYDEVPLNKDFKTDWLILTYHKLGKSNKEICGKLKFIHKIKNIKVDRIKQTITRLKLRIEQIEVVTRK